MDSQPAFSQDLLAHTLSFLPIRERLCVATNVSKAWRVAAIRPGAWKGCRWDGSGTQLEKLHQVCPVAVRQLSSLSMSSKCPNFLSMASQLQLVSLHTLTMRADSYGGPMVTDSAVLASFPSLKHLQLSGCLVKGAAMTKEVLPRLQTLSLSAYRMEPVALWWKEAPNLTDLTVDSCTIWDERIFLLSEHIRSSPSNPEYDSVYITGLDKFQQLKRIELRSPYYKTGFPASIIDQLSHCPFLCDVSIRYIEPFDPDVLLQCKHLQHVFIEETQGNWPPLELAESATSTSSSKAPSRHCISLRSLKLATRECRVDPKWTDGVYSLRSLVLQCHSRNTPWETYNWMRQLPANHPWLLLEVLSFTVGTFAALRWLPYGYLEGIAAFSHLKKLCIDWLVSADDLKEILKISSVQELSLGANRSEVKTPGKLDWEDVFASHAGLPLLRNLDFTYRPTTTCVQWLLRCPRLRRCKFIDMENLQFSAECVPFPVRTLFQSHAALSTVIWDGYWLRRELNWENH